MPSPQGVPTVVLIYVFVWGPHKLYRAFSHLYHLRQEKEKWISAFIGVPALRQASGGAPLEVLPRVYVVIPIKRQPKREAFLYLPMLDSLILEILYMTTETRRVSPEAEIGSTIDK